MSDRRKARILNYANHDPSQQLSTKDLCVRIIALAQALSEKRFYKYQVPFIYRFIESLLLHDGQTITALISRQSGKTEALGSAVAALSVILPYLAKAFPNDWKLNITDDNGVYRGFKDGVKIGIYAPRLAQSEIMFQRVKLCLATDTATRVLAELGIQMAVMNGTTIRMTNGSRILCETASPQSNIEGETHHALVIEECQDVDDQKIRKSLSPMVAAYSGSIMKIGTASTKKCDFYSSIKANERRAMMGGPRNHFCYTYRDAILENSLYKAYVETQKEQLGEDSDEFRMSYGCEWIFERGMFVTSNLLFHIRVAHSSGTWAFRHRRIPRMIGGNYKIVMGIDWASAMDSTVLTLVAVDWTNPTYSQENRVGGRVDLYTKHIIDWYEFHGDNYEVQFSEITGTIIPSLGRDLAKITMDSNTCGRPIFDRFGAHYRGYGITIDDFNFNAKLKSDGYKNLYGDICTGRITFPASEAVTRSRLYRAFVTQMLDAVKDYSRGLMNVSHPDEKGAHGDYCDSLMLASWGASQPLNNIISVYSEGNAFFNPNLLN